MTYKEYIATHNQEVAYLIKHNKLYMRGNCPDYYCHGLKLNPKCDFSRQSCEDCWNQEMPECDLIENEPSKTYGKWIELHLNGEPRCFDIGAIKMVYEYSHKTFISIGVGIDYQIDESISYVMGAISPGYELSLLGNRADP